MFVELPHWALGLMLKMDAPAVGQGLVSINALVRKTPNGGRALKAHA